jgi:hypothetical protein
MLKGVVKLTPLTLKQDTHKTITIRMISHIKDILDETNPFNSAFFTCLTTIFYTAAWVGKFTTQRLDTFNPTEHITWGGVHDDTNCTILHTKVFMLPHTKSSPKGEEVHWVRQDGPTDPLDTFNRHIIINNPPLTALILLIGCQKATDQ